MPMHKKAATDETRIKHGKNQGKEFGGLIRV
jgi:hypothetical protein